MWCWGEAEYGALGHEEGIAPAVVPGVKAIRVEVGLRHTCALDPQQRVWCWGGNNRGQLGKGSVDEGKGAPAVALEGAQALSVGSDATCAVVGGNLNCWGLNDEAQVFGRAAADGSDYLAKPTPTGLVDVSVVALATDHGCAMTAAKGVHCWGNNRWGQHGAGPRGLWSNSPVKVQRAWP